MFYVVAIEYEGHSELITEKPVSELLAVQIASKIDDGKTLTLLVPASFPLTGVNIDFLHNGVFKRFSSCAESTQKRL